jgi:hypothetical protein
MASTRSSPSAARYRFDRPRPLDGLRVTATARGAATVCASATVRAVATVRAAGVRCRVVSRE